MKSVLMKKGRHERNKSSIPIGLPEFHWIWACWQVYIRPQGESASCQMRILSSTPNTLSACSTAASGSRPFLKVLGHLVQPRMVSLNSLNSSTVTAECDSQRRMHRIIHTSCAVDTHLCMPCLAFMISAACPSQRR